MESTQIRQGQIGYRRGLILGLTMAEVLLLLLFCLMMSFAALQANSGEEAIQLQLAESENKVEELQERLELFAPLLSREVDPLLFERMVSLLSSLDTDLLSKFAEVDKKSLGQLIELANLNPKPSDWRELTEALQPSTSNSEKSTSELLVEAVKVSIIAEEIGVGNLEDPQIRSEVQDALVKLRNGEGLNEWPPIISLSEANNNFFELGSAVPAEQFVSTLQNEITAKLVSTLQEYNVDLIEVIGHTDEQAITRRSTNLDTKAIPVLLGLEPTNSLQTADNAGLGLARAIAVARILGTQQQLSGIPILPYSAGQLVLPSEETTDGKNIKDEKTRRRIEIRVRRKDEKT